VISGGSIEMALCALVNNSGEATNVFVQGPKNQFRAFAVAAGATVLMEATPGRKALLAFTTFGQFLVVMRPIDVPQSGAVFPLFRGAPIPTPGGVASYSAEVDSGDLSFEGQSIDQIQSSGETMQGEDIEIIGG
jgi:hypothetical protein